MRYEEGCSAVGVYTRIPVIRNARPAWCYSPNPRRSSHAAGAHPHHDIGGDFKGRREGKNMLIAFVPE